MQRTPRNATRFRFGRFPFALVLGLALSPEFAAASGLKAEIAWARASLGGVKNAIVYGTFVNEGTDTMRLVGGSTPVADRIEFHLHAMDGNVMTMKQLDAIALKPGETATLKPGGLHIMLINLKRPLKEGESFPLTLTPDSGDPDLHRGQGPGRHGHRTDTIGDRSLRRIFRRRLRGTGAAFAKGFADRGQPIPTHVRHQRESLGCLDYTGQEADSCAHYLLPPANRRRSSRFESRPQPTDVFRSRPGRRLPPGGSG